MNSAEHITRLAKGMTGLMKWPLLCGLLSFALVRSVSAGQPVFENDAIISYPGTTNFPPVIDATNFINTGTFIINFTSFSATQPFYETSDTLNYTNSDTGLMEANTGFQFDTKFSGGTGGNAMADSFHNSGIISCGSTSDTNDPFGGLLFEFGFNPQCLINASNIVNPGTVDVGEDGMIQFAGQIVDLTRSVLNEEGNGANAFGTGDYGLNTNGWDPSFELGPNTAESSFFYVPPYELFLTNSTAYIKVDLNAEQGTNVIRAVFIQDTSGSNVSATVYFGVGRLGAGVGSATIQWAGSYLDAASGNTYSNYLYLTDDYDLGASTNVVLNNGYPDNFTFSASPTPLFIGAQPAPAGFQPVFSSGSITNRYAFGNVDFISTTVSTNDNSIDPTHSITNLPGRIQIYASNELNLAYAQVTGPNYLSVKSTNQFDGSPGALIESPYADLNLGVTNGFLTISNLMVPQIPNWKGNIQAWTTRWIGIDANGATNDYRVLIVGSQLLPTTVAQVQDLILHGTNSIVISDSLNVMRTFTADAQNLTLTTNGVGVGATSADGELNAEFANVLWGSSMPNLLNLTNNGAIRLQNLGQFISNSNIVSVTPGIDAVAATGTLSEVAGRANVLAGNKVVIGTNDLSYIYTFQNNLTNSVPNQVKIASSFDGSMSNLIAAINHGAGAGTSYSTNTTANSQVTAGLLTSHAFTVTANVPGANGNSLVAENFVATTNLTWNVTNYLSGGAEAVAAVTNITTVQVPYYNFINNGLASDQGSTIWANNFVNSGTISNGVNSFTLNSLTTTLTNGLIDAGGSISITADSLIASNVVLQAGKSLNLVATNLLTDTGVTNGNIWTVGSNSTTAGFSLTIKPQAGDLTGTTITNIGPAGKQIVDTWAGEDRGYSLSGFTNNAAIGRLILDSLGNSLSGAQFKFVGAGTSNAIYVDYLELRDYATNFGSMVASNLNFGTNLVIYYAEAVMNGQLSASWNLNHANNDHLRWVSNYVGYYSSTNIVYPDGTTNTVNAPLSQDPFLDSDGDGIDNSHDPTPFFIASQVNFNLTLTNNPSKQVNLIWNSIPNATNYLYYKTNLLSSNWMVLTNFVSPANVPPVNGWPITNTVSDLGTNQTRFYQLRVTLP